jgi:GalNAc-alpha-(1->4)-GalNAc-alpha-(1->3)-diNAcBac-PP-undecaprenol alpha-1,4-N-acetyl-D-galactosaminyltransferase
MRIAIVNYDLGAGGAERVLSLLAKEWSKRGHRVQVITLDTATPAYALPGSVEICQLGVAGPTRGWGEAIRANLHRIARIRAAIRACRPDVVIAFTVQTDVLVLLATRGLRIPVIVCEHTDPLLLRLPWPWRLLRAVTYRFAQAATCLAPGSLASLQTLVGQRAHVVPNPVLPQPAKGECPDLPDGNLLVSMGRLVPVKRFDVLLQVFASLSQKYPDWNLLILGNGPRRMELEQEIDRLGLRNRAFLLGWLADPFPVLRRAQLYALTSAREGFPMAMCEAMAAGVPVVAFDCGAGVPYLVRNGIDGVLVPPGDVNAFTHNLDALMADPSWRARLQARAPEVLQRFGMPKVLAIWDNIFREVACQ